jgi:hypothetical protein
LSSEARITKTTIVQIRWARLPANSVQSVFMAAFKPVAGCPSPAAAGAVRFCR